MLKKAGFSLLSPDIFFGVCKSKKVSGLAATLLSRGAMIMKAANMCLAIKDAHSKFTIIIIFRRKQKKVDGYPCGLPEESRENLPS